MKQKLLFATRLIVLLCATAALVVLTAKTLNASGSLLNLLSFYTIQSNIIVLGVLLTTLILPKSQRLDLVRGAATLYIVITGVIYHALLANVDVQTGRDWINTVVHTLTPVYMLIDWLIDRPLVRIPLKRSILWLIYPLVYAVYTLIRGAFVDWYPYPFIDVATYGYAQILVNCVLILIGFLILAVGVALLPRLFGRIRTH